MTPSQEKPIGPKLFLSLGLIIVSGAYALWQNMSGASQTALTTPTPPQDQQPTSIQITPSQPYIKEDDEDSEETSPVVVPVSAPTPTPTPVPAPTPASKPTSKPAGLYADGSYTGSAADAYYGTVQVKAVIAGGKIIDVQFLQYPNTRSNSRVINSQALPLLTQEAIQAQSANVNGVSGATFTSGAFKVSLAAALALAKN